MAQTTMDTSFGPYGECFFFSFIFTDTNACLLHIQLLIYMLRGMETGGRLRRWEMAQTMPDTSFGPCGECFFFSYSFLLSVFFFPFVFINTNACLLHTQLLIYMLCGMKTGNGPNDAGHVVWALW